MTCSTACSTAIPQNPGEYQDADEILVLGIGNPLQSDDGAGPRAVQLLAKYDLPANVRLVEAGCPGWGLPSLLQGQHSVVFLDAVEMGKEPGAWRRFGLDEVKLWLYDGALSLHEPGLANGLSLAEALGWLPDEIIIFGIQPTMIGPGDDLSPAVENGLKEMTAHAAADIKELAVTKALNL